MIDFNDGPLVATLELLGVEGKFYLGIRVTIFDRASLTSQGFFLSVKPKQWELTAAEKSKVRSQPDLMQGALHDFYWLPKYLKNGGADKIFATMTLRKRIQTGGHSKDHNLGNYNCSWPSVSGRMHNDCLLRDQTDSTW